MNAIEYIAVHALQQIEAGANQHSTTTLAAIAEEALEQIERERGKEKKAFYAGAKVWIGDKEVTKVVDKHVIDREMESGMAITFAAQSCLDTLAEVDDEE